MKHSDERGAQVPRVLARGGHGLDASALSAATPQGLVGSSQRAPGRAIRLDGDGDPSEALVAGGRPACSSPEEFAAFYKSTLSEVYTYLFHRSGGIRSVAEDLTQETFLSAVAAINRRDGSDLTLPWLLGVARHKLMDHFRKKGREERRLFLVAGANSADEAARESGLAARDRALSALASVPATQQAALVLRYLDDLTVPQVAEILGKSVHATESLLARGREHLRRSFGESDHD